VTEPRSQKLSSTPASSTPATTTTAATETVVVLKGLVKPMSEASIGPRIPKHDNEEDKSEEERK
jgi:GC-rich sequence DNA-binding factor